MFRNIIRDAFSLMLDIVFPKSKIERQIDALSPENFAARARARRIWSGEDIVALFDYTDPLIKQMIWSLKFSGSRRAAELFGGAAADYLVEECADHALFGGESAMLIVPVPLSQKRFRERGYNQSARIATHVSAEHAEFTLCSEALERIAHTAPQTSIESRRARLQNVRGAFRAARPDLIAGKDIVLLDDVATTGSTIREARRALMRAGARSVLPIAIAH